MSEQRSRRAFLKSSALKLGAGVAAVTAAGCSTSGTVIVGTGSTNPPWHFEDEKVDLQGFDIEMARLLAKGLFDDPGKVQFVRRCAGAQPADRPGRTSMRRPWCTR
jgi:ABC-type amino acid transport substrate-binding protein